MTVKKAEVDGIGLAAAAGTRPGGARTRRNEAIDVAERLLEAEGPDALTMRRIGVELGIRGSSRSSPRPAACTATR
jgi:hypothetical protein